MIKLVDILNEALEEKEIQSLAKEFMSSDSYDPSDDCKKSTGKFVSWVKKNKGFEPDVLLLAPPSKEVVRKNPALKGKSGDGDSHIFAIVDGYGIDFTANQFPGVSNPLKITPENQIKSVYSKIGGYYSDAPEWFEGGKTSLKTKWANLPDWMSTQVMEVSKLIDILFENNYPVSKPQIERDEEDNSIISVNYHFNTDKNKYEVVFNSFERPRVFEVEFGVDKGETFGLDTDEMTGEGKALSILSTIANIINSFLQNFSNEYDKVVISGTNEKRKEVYRKFFPKKINPEYLDKVVIREGIDDPVKPGILKKRLGKLSCSRVRSAKSKLKNKGTHYAKALQRYLNYHC